MVSKATNATFMTKVISIATANKVNLVFLFLVPFAQLFEGMKAYRAEDGKVRLFRPDQNMERMLGSAKRSSLPVSCL